ncbi:unnamed protein product [Prorocentrum cordatum]|uniref:Uncharacterized protein n=1 Tax=Prorocentrum cordatum TaxID=2364126 RepID=A0ABN9Q117_9DINO|nr:unnamed protein product [Polarella glacialis]
MAVLRSAGAAHLLSTGLATLTLNYWTLSFNFNIITNTEGQHRHTTRPMNCHKWNNCTLNVTGHMDYPTQIAKDYWTLKINSNIITNIEGQHMQDYNTLTLNDWTLNFKFNILTNTEGQYVQDWTLSFKFNIFTNTEGQHRQDYDTLTPNYWTLSFNFNILTNTEGQHMQNYTTRPLNCHQWNDCTLNVTCHMLLQTTHKTRLNGSNNTDTYTMRKELPGIIAITQEIEGYKYTLDSPLRKSDTPEDKKRLQEIGSPAPPFALAILEGLYKCDVGGSMEGAIRNHLHRAETEDIEANTDIPIRVMPILFTDLNQGPGRRSRQRRTDNAIGSYQPSDETELGRLIHDKFLTHQLTAINMHIDVGKTYYGHNKARSSINYVIGHDNFMEIVKHVKLNWKIHTKLSSLLHVADHIPMIMQIKMSVSGANITNNNTRWDYGLLAAGPQTGAHRASSLNDAYAEISKDKEALRVVKMDPWAPPEASVSTSSLLSATTHDGTDTDDETNPTFECNIGSCQKRITTRSATPRLEGIGHRYDDTKQKLVIGAPMWEGQAVHHRGMAPVGWPEEEVGHWLETLEQ